MFHVKHNEQRGARKMKTFAIKGNAINLFIKAESMEAAAQIIRAPLGEIAKHLTGVWFERR